MKPIRSNPNFYRKYYKCDQGQLTIDYLAGITILLFAIFFVFQYTSGLFTPFQSNSDEITMITDRTAMVIVENRINSNDVGTPNLVDEEKADMFFTNLNTDYDSTIDSLGLNSSYFDYNLNVTMENESSGVFYSGGKPLPKSSNIGQTKRVVLLKYGDPGSTEIALMSVRVW